MGEQCNESGWTMGFAGNLRQYPLTEVLRLIGEGQQRGRLVVERGGLSAEIYCEVGYIWHVWRIGNVIPLAQMWLNVSFISPVQMTQIATIIGRDPFTLSDMEFAQVALDRGIVSSEAVTQWVMNDAVDLFSILMTWPDGDYRFEDGFAPAAQRLRWQLYIPQVLGLAMERVGQLPTPQPAVNITLDDVLDFADLDPTDPHPVQVTRDQWHVLTRVDGESPLRNIAHALTLATIGGTAGDPQRFAMELHRSEEIAQRIGGELIAEGLALIMVRSRE